MTYARPVVVGATTALCRRTVGRKAFLGEWDPLVSDIFRYALYDAAAETGVCLHQSTRVITHHHTDVTPYNDNLPEFCRRFHRDVSCALNQLLLELRYDAPRQLFDDQGTHCMRLLDASAQAAHLTYGKVNCVSAGLVRRPKDMPGWTFDYGLWKPDAVDVVKRPPIFFSKDRAEERTASWEPTPLLYELFEGDIEALIYWMRRLESDACREINRARGDRVVLGAKSIRRMHAWNEPSSLREPGGRLKPLFKLGANDLIGKKARIAASEEVTAFRKQNRAQYYRFRAGYRDEPFPFATYGMRVTYGAKVEPKPGDNALLTRPGPTLEDVKRAIETQEREANHALLIPPPEAKQSANEARNRVLDEVALAFSTEASELITENAMSFDGTTERTQKPDTLLEHTEHGARPREATPAVRHRLRNVELRDDLPRPSRVIVLRDARRGRPKGSSDPPK